MSDELRTHLLSRHNRDGLRLDGRDVRIRAREGRLLVEQWDGSRWLKIGLVDDFTIEDDGTVRPKDETNTPDPHSREWLLATGKERLGRMR